MPTAEFSDPRLVELYDTVCPPGPDDAFFLDLADRLGAVTIVDVGCGTGALAAALARPGRRVIGVDPAPAMLTVAWPRSMDVEWLDGTAHAVPAVAADLAVLKSHVAQLIVDDAQWADTLGEVARFVRPGGRIAFDSRDPRAIEHGAGTKYERARRFPHDRYGWVELRQVLTDIERDPDGGGTVHGELHYAFADGSTAVSAGPLRFRTRERLTAQLADAGFAVEDVFGDHDRRAVGPDTGEFVVVAVRR